MGEEKRIEIEQDIEAEHVESTDYYFHRIGKPIPIAKDNSNDSPLFQLETPPSQPLALSLTHRLIFVAHSSGFYVARTNDVMDAAKDMEDKSTCSSIQQLCLVDVPLSDIRILSVSSDSSTLAVSAAHSIHFFSIDSLINKDVKPAFSDSLPEATAVKDFKWTKASQTSYLVLSDDHKLFHAALHSPLKHVLDDVDAVDWSVKGKFIAVARDNFVNILFSKFKERLRVSLPFKSWIGDSDDKCTVRVDSISWVRHDSIVVGCFQQTADDMEENYLLQVIKSTDGKITDASCKPLVLSFHDLFPGLIDDVVPNGTGPYLFLSYLEQCGLALAANRKNTDQHVVLLGWSINNDTSEVAAIDIERDGWLPRIELQDNGDDNLIMGLCVDKVSLYEKVKVEVGVEEQKELSPYCVLICVTFEGMLVMFHVASVAESATAFRSALDDDEEDILEEVTEVRDESSFLSKDEHEAPSVSRQLGNFKEMVKELDMLLDSIEGAGGFKDACIGFQRTSVEFLEEGTKALSEKTRMWKSVLDDRIVVTQNLLDKTVQEMHRLPRPLRRPQEATAEREEKDEPTIQKDKGKKPMVAKDKTKTRDHVLEEVIARSKRETIGGELERPPGDSSDPDFESREADLLAAAMLVAPLQTLRNDQDDWDPDQPFPSIVPTSTQDIIVTHSDGDRESHISNEAPIRQESSHEEIPSQVLEEALPRSEHSSQKTLYGKTQIDLQTETHGEQQEATQKTEENYEEVYTLDPEDNRENIPQETINKPNGDLPSQETRTVLNKRLQGTSQEQICSEPSPINTEMDVPEDSLLRERSPVPCSQTVVQISHGGIRTRTHPPDIYDISDTGSNIGIFQPVPSPNTMVSYISGFIKLVDSLLRPGLSLKDFTTRFLSLETQKMIHSLRDQQWIPYEQRIGLDTLMYTWHEGRNGIGDMLEQGLPKELIFSSHPFTFANSNMKEDCCQELEEMKAVKRILEEQLSEVNNKIQTLERRLEILANEEETVARCERIRRVSEKSKTCKLLSFGSLLELQEWLHLLISEK